MAQPLPLMMMKRVLLSLVLGVAMFCCLRVSFGSTADSQSSWQSWDHFGASDCVAGRPTVEDRAYREREELSKLPGFQFLALPVVPSSQNFASVAWPDTGTSNLQLSSRLLGLQSRAPPAIGLA